MHDETAEEDAMSELVPLDSPARGVVVHPMRPSDWNHVERLVDLQESLTRQKYEAGRGQHGGDLWSKAGMIAHAIDEATDLSVYLLTLRDQVSHIAADLRSAGITPEDAADALDRLLRQ